MRSLGIPAVTRRFLSVPLFMLVWLGAWSECEATCTCLKDSSPQEQQVRAALRNADYVALIKIKAVEFKDKSWEEPIAVWNPRTQQSDEEVRQVSQRVMVGGFDVLRHYKGPKSPVRVETPAAADSCGIKFEPGSTYLVYAYGDIDDALISTDRCMRTALQARAAQDIEVLDAVLQPKSVVKQPSGAAQQLAKATGLIHSHAGSNDERLQDPKLVGNLMAAMQIADELAKSDPLSGYSQVIRAELISTWQLGEKGTPIEAQQEALKLAEDALRIDPKLAQAHVAKARTYAKAGRFPEASEEVQRALQLDPRLDSAMFVQADVYRLSGNTAKAIEWIRMFTDATPQSAQKANGHEWLGQTYRDIAYHPDANNRETYLLMARSSFQWSIDLDGGDPWRLAGFATFLNENVADFTSAEKYAAMALAIEDIEPAHLQLAAARYQSLQAKAAEMDLPSLQAAIVDIQRSTRHSLDELVQPGVFREVVRLRLVRLQRKALTPAK